MKIDSLLSFTETEIVKDESSLYASISKAKEKFDLSSPAKVKSHNETDLALIDKIENLLEPTLGFSGIGEERWFQSMDFYGDGVRLIETEQGVINEDLAKQLQSLLNREHQNFSILWKEYRNYKKEAFELYGAMIIRHSGLVIMQSLLNGASHA